MKFLKAIVVVVLLGIAALIMIGVFVPEVDEEVEIHVNQPIVTVFAGMMNTQGLPKWVDGLETVERTGGFLAMPGSTFKLKFEDAETSETYELEILEVQPMKSVKFELASEMMEIDGTINFEADGRSTDVSAYMQMRGKGLLERSVLPLMKSVIADEIEQDFQNFKELQEQ
jgi:uncharacterized membrane protein